MNYIGRFAPSPSGHLHMGSLLAAVASYADAKHHSGKWKLRIDNIDLSRVAKDSELSILKTLENLGFKWDGAIRYQDNNKQYLEALEYLLEQKQAYYCQCSRKEIYQNNNQGSYTGFCRNQNLQQTFKNNFSVRIKSQVKDSQFVDQVQGKQLLKVDQQEDYIIKRSDNIISYHLSSVIDDYLENITHIVRGNDLISSSLKQDLLLKQLHFPIPSYAHIPLLLNHEGIKLSKRSGAEAVTSTIEALFQAARYLGQKPDKTLLKGTIEDFWHELIQNWDMSKVPKHANIEENQIQVIQ